MIWNNNNLKVTTKEDTDHERGSQVNREAERDADREDSEVEREANRKPSGQLYRLASQGDQEEEDVDEKKQAEWQEKEHFRTAIITVCYVSLMQYAEIATHLELDPSTACTTLAAESQAWSRADVFRLAEVKTNTVKLRFAGGEPQSKRRTSTSNEIVVHSQKPRRPLLPK
jgi:hypothetical protein